ncbi:MAG: ArsR family transcriptional regulator [Deltaproteobacteria bacterium]|nr:ArsR family transcriptional regulator [Deltaproteobacteria bacterium]
MGTTFDLGSTLFGKARRAVLALTLGHPDESFHLRRIARFAGMGMGAVQRELQQLTQVGILRRTVSGRQVYYQADRDCPVFAELHGLVLKTAGVADVLRDALVTLGDRITVAVIYGSVARASERRGSDVDVMVVGEVSFADCVDALGPAQERLGREVNPTVYPPAEFLEKMRARNHFLARVLAAPKIFLIGSERDLARLAQERLAE